MSLRSGCLSKPICITRIIDVGMVLKVTHDTVDKTHGNCGLLLTIHLDQLLLDLPNQLCVIREMTCTRIQEKTHATLDRQSLLLCRKQILLKKVFFVGAVACESVQEATEGRDRALLAQQPNG